MVVIYQEDDEATRKRKREVNRQEIGEEYRKGAIYMCAGIPENCLVKQQGKKEV